MPVAKSEEWTSKLGIPMLELWGMPELAGPGIMQHSYGENRLGAAGIEMPYFRAKIVDPEDVTRELPNGEVGELIVYNPSGTVVLDQINETTIVSSVFWRRKIPISRPSRKFMTW